MSRSGHEIALAARRWIGTPYVHQARARGAGCDCLGLVLGLWEEVLGPLPETPPRYTPDWSEMAREERLWSAASRHLVAKEPEVAAAGDVILFRMREGAVAKHLGVQSVTGAAPRFIHAWSGHGVVETRLTPPWVRRTVARFAFPERS